MNSTLLALALLSVTLVQVLKSSSNMNLSNMLHVNDYISTKSISIPENKPGINYSAMEPVLFESLYNIKLLHSVVRVTTFFKFSSTKVALSILQYAHDFDENLQTLYSKVVMNNIYDSKAHNERQCILSYWALLKLRSNKLANCKVQIRQLITQVDNIFTTID